MAQTKANETPKAVDKSTARAWEALTPGLSTWVLDAISSMGFQRMTPVQASAIPLFMGNKDVVVEVRLAFWINNDRPKLIEKPRQ